jgi:hypothetical protein
MDYSKGRVSEFHWLLGLTVCYYGEQDNGLKDG